MGSKGVSGLEGGDRLPHKVLIIGYGNQLRGDDAVGFLAAARLRVAIADPEVEILAVAQLTPEFAYDISRAGRVIFIDAATDGEPGAIQRRSVAAAAAVADPAAFTHSTTPEALLAASAALFGNTPPAVLYSIAGESFELSEELTPPVARSLEDLLARLQFLVTE